MKWFRFLNSCVFPVIILLIFFQHSAHGAVIFVKTDGNNANSGSTWALAKQTVQAAIMAANQGDEIWVAAGTYAEHIKNKTIGPSGSEVAVDTALYGGFVGTETSRDERNWQTNLTILDGGGADSPTVNGSVVIIDSSAAAATRIDGFVITKGHGIGAGGIFIGGSGPVIANNTIVSNIANGGGGILIDNYKITEPQAHPIVTGNTIMYNYAIEAGGGIAVIGSGWLAIALYDPVSPTISGNNIVRNVSAVHGGGIGVFGHAAPKIMNNRLIGNTAAYDEATFLGNGGGIYATSRDVDDTPIEYAISAPVIVSNVIEANGANFGGGIYLWDTEADHGGIPVVTNNTVVGNNGTGISWITTYPIIQNNLVAYNSRGLEQGDILSPPTTLRNNCVYGNELWEQNTNYNGLSDQTGISGNISADPLMANYRIGNFHLQADSPCVDAGYSAAVENGWTDIDGQARTIGSEVDIGADESDGTVAAVPTPIYYVKSSGDDSQNGLSWATAKKTVTATIGAAQYTGGEIWVAAGTYTERNILPAFIYLYGGFSGIETARTGRNVTGNPTILDGGGGVPTVVNSLYAGYFLSTIDGFTIQNGGLYTGGSVPTGSQGYRGRGGGIYCQVTSPLIQNNIIRHNSLGNPFDSANKPGYGGGIYAYLSYALIQDNTITENEVIAINGQGGGIYFFRSMPTILRNAIINNRAKYGAAIYALNAHPRILENTIENNSFYNNMPGYYMGATEGAVTLDMNWDFLVERNLIKGNTAGATGGVGAGINAKTNLAGRIQNNLIVNNSANGMGGGIYALAPLNATSSLYILNNTVVGNSAISYGTEGGGGIGLSIPPAITGPDPIPNRVVIANNIIGFSTSGIFETLTNPIVPPTLVKNDVFNTGQNYINLTQGVTDIHVDPGFVDRAGGNYRLIPNSPCIDAGENTVNGLPSTDYSGNVRIVDGNGDGNHVIDIGAMEYNGRAPAMLYATYSAYGLYKYDGSAWNRIDTVIPTSMVASGSNLYASYAGSGLYKYDGSSWVRLDTVVPTSMVGSGSTLYATFTGYGLYIWNGSAWSRIDTTIPTNIAVSDSILYAGYTGYGLYKYEGSTWTRLDTNVPTSMIASGSTLYATFAGYGLYIWNGSAWSRIDTTIPAMITASGSTLYAAYTGSGLYRYTGSTWTRIDTVVPENMVASGSSLYATYAGSGLYKYDGSSWVRLDTVIPENMVGGN